MAEDEEDERTGDEWDEIERENDIEALTGQRCVGGPRCKQRGPPTQR